MIPFAAAGAFLGRIPAWVWVALALIAGGWYYGHTRYEAGQADVKAEWNASVERGKKEVERLKKEAGKVTVRYETKTVTVVKTIKEKGEAIVKIREVFVPVDSGYLSGGFRLFFNAAIEGAVPDSASIPNAAPVAVTDVADTHARNMEKCKIAYATVDLWQQWSAEQLKVNPGE
jgi:hypothetical protein